MRVPTLLLTLIALAACADPPPSTTCTGPDPADGAPVERLPFDTSGLDFSCDTGGEELGQTFAVVATVARSADEVLAVLGCTEGSVGVDFANEEVIVIDAPDTVVVDGLFEVDGSLVVATSSGPGGGCRGAAPSTNRTITVLQRTGDDTTPASRTCVTVDPPPPSLFPPGPCLAP